MTSRRVKEGTQVQGVDEQIVYSLTTTPWCSLPASIAVVAKDKTVDLADVSATVLSGAASANGDVISLPTLSGLTKDHTYRIEVKFSAGGNTFEAYFEVAAEL